MTRLLLLILLWACPLHAQTVAVKSGDHDGFTRLVLTFPAPVDWVLGRSSGGYGLRLTGPALRYDLASVYQLITKDRLRSIWVDPATGVLELGVDCACHALPFELSRSVLVIDIKDGAPPDGSSFEIGLQDGIAAPPLGPAPRQRPRRNTRLVSGYDWLQIADLSPANDRPVVPLGLQSAPVTDSFHRLLIAELGRAATQGVVQMAKPDASPDPSAQPAPQNARTAIGTLPGLTVSTDSTARPDLMVQGGQCPAADQPNLASLAGAEDPATELARARADLLSEFDVPVPEKVLFAADTYLQFGFGAEARALLTTILPPALHDAQRLALSYIVDGDPTPDNPFQDMQSCASAAALWSLLAAAPDDTLPYLNGAAISQAFLALPAPLRALLGPETVRRLSRAGDDANAEVVRASFVRASPADHRAVPLLAADQALQDGDPAMAETLLPPEANDETGLLALLSLVEARFSQRKPIDGTERLALEAFAFEQDDGPHGTRLRRALAHAAALGGDFDAAFRHAEGQDGVDLDVWALLAEMGGESALLTHAVGPAPDTLTKLPMQLRADIAERLLGAGLPNVAATWAPAAEAQPDLAARIALANGDARSALRLLALHGSGDQAALLAASYLALGDFGAASEAYRTAGDLDQATRLQRWAGLRQADPVPDPALQDPALPPLTTEDPWAVLLRQTAPAETSDTLPPLRAGAARLDQSASTRQAIASLLAAAPVVSDTPP